MSCGTRKYLQEGESYLEQNSVKIKSDLNVQDKGELKEDLLSLAVQKTQSKLAVGSEAMVLFSNEK